MTRRLSFLALIVPGLLSAGAIAQERPAPFYSLPADGTWVEYRWVHTPRDGKKQKGTLRLSAVGGKLHDGKPHRWVEIRLDTERADGKAARRVRKLLVAPDRLDRGLAAAVAACYDQSGDGPPAKLSPAKTTDFLGMGLHGEGAKFQGGGTAAAVDTALGKLDARLLVAKAEAREYRVWMTERVPFGWARFDIREATAGEDGRTVFSAEVLKRGAGAASELDETKTR